MGERMGNGGPGPWKHGSGGPHGGTVAARPANHQPAPLSRAAVRENDPSFQ